MSISIIQSPESYQSAHQEVWHVVESTNKAVPGFQYVFDIYKSGSLVTRVKNSPYGANKVGVLDVSTIARASLNTPSAPVIDSFTFSSATELGADVFWSDYDIRFGEVSGGVLTANVASGTYRVYNNYKRQGWDNKQTDTSKILMTNRPIESVWYANEPIIISANYYPGYDFTRELVVNGSIVSSYTNTGNGNAFVFSFVPSADSSMLRIKRDASIREYINFTKKCSKYDTHSLLFLNAFGVWDTFTFVYGKKTMDNEKKRFQQLNWGLNVSNNMTNLANRTTYNEASKVYATSYGIKMQLTSDILSTDEYNWLSELINSPVVYYYDKTNAVYYPVILSDSNYEFKDDRINKADTLTVNIEFSDRTNSQYR